MQTNTPLLFIGIGIGFSLAVIGGSIDYWLARRNQYEQRERLLPGCMLYLAGALGAAGLIAIVVSLVFSRSIGPALVLGAGVLAGFYAGFALLMFLYLFVKRYWPSARG